MYSKMIEDKIKEIGNDIDLNKLDTETDRIKVIDILNALGKEFNAELKLSFDIKTVESARYLLYRMIEYSGEVCKGGIKIESDILSDLNTLFIKIHSGEQVIQELNNRLAAVQADNGLLLAIKFKFGLGEYCRVADWDYSKITLYTSTPMLNSLIDNTTADNINEYIGNLVGNMAWDENISEFIKKFNGSSLSVKLQAALKDVGVDETLAENMISIPEVKDIIKKNAGLDGVQKIKSVKTMDTLLGSFAAIIIWNIDYTNYEISVDILDDKVLDIKNDRFILDHSLYSRIKQIIDDETDLVADEFRRMAS